MAKERLNERELQHRCVEWFRETYPDCLILSIPNESAHNRVNYFVYTGLLRGAADLVLVLPEKVVFVEMKTRYGKQSDDQIHFEGECRKLGVPYHLCRSLEEFQAVVGTYM
ncbi:MAG: VRR-NUC domain-containing protein [Bacteroidales bacterium]|nr:VRR-NUC domain-containing protein [Bacteroidales bacterium]MBR4637037.1 VRR-NUC domain-containing protein [Bacteroidales bacterium]